MVSATLKGTRSLDKMLSAPWKDLLTRSRKEGAVFGASTRLAHGREATLTVIGNNDKALVICADSASEINDYYQRITSTPASGSGYQDDSEIRYDHITRLNNELINAQRHLAKTNARHARDLERLGLTLANIGSGVILVDAYGRVEMVNQAAKDMLRSDGDLVGRPVDEVYRISEESSAIRAAGEFSGSKPVMGSRLLDMQGGTLHVIESVTPIEEKGSVIAFQDVTPIFAITEELKSSNEMLRMIMKVMRHDILNHLTVVAGFIELVDPDSENLHLQKAAASLKKSEHIVRQMKEMEALVLSQEDLRPYGLSEVIRPLMEAGSVSWYLDGDAVVMADPSLSSVIDNLVMNAMKHGSATRIEFIIEQRTDAIELSVADDGTGVPEEVRGNLFKEGVSYGKKANTGLGLFLARKAMERYGGSIRLEDNTPRGARFVLTFPRP